MNLPEAIPSFTHSFRHRVDRGNVTASETDRMPALGGRDGKEWDVKQIK